ncbi:MAG: asparagine synthase (glutamine-hydrolyzing) [Candidatus Pacebacteria bacterium]|nr:asparagine synthase (glutamine-hydrolyzing) [Candidatus Paceibacterota bacterium]
MCAIAGIVDTKKGIVAQEKLERMVASLVHRGPDDGGIYLEGNVGLGHRRLSIIDLSKAGHQPMPSSTGRYQLTFNGEIYNYLELKNELGVHTFRTSTDSEVILRAYEEWGDECVKKFNGIFSFAIWDTKEQTLFCARDHLGVKPFHYAFKNGIFYFASEIKGILAAGDLAARPNEKLIYEYLSYGMYDHSPESFFDEIVQLPAGHTLNLKGSVVQVTRYWSLPEEVIDTSSWSDNRVKEEFLGLFQSAIALQLRSDVPVGIHVSGGVDSSILTDTINRQMNGQRNFRMFSFAYGNSKYDETPFVNELAEALKWNVQTTHLIPEDVIRLAESSVWHQDQPHSGLPSLALQRLVESYKDSDIKVILEGQGGDEITAGYEYYMGAFLLDTLRLKGEAAVEKEKEGFLRFHSFDSREKESAFFANALNSYYHPGGSADGSSFTKPHVLKDAFRVRAHAEAPIFDAPFNTALANMQYRDIFHTKLPRVLRSCDRASMTYGRELRVPLLDYRLVEFCMSLSLDQRIRNGEQRFFVRNAFRDKLPKHIVDTPKRAVVNPQREWLGKELRPWVENILSSKSFGERPFFNQTEVLEEYKNYCDSTQKTNSFHIWQWVNMELWARAFLD